MYAGGSSALYAEGNDTKGRENSHVAREFGAQRKRAFENIEEDEAVSSKGRDRVEKREAITPNLNVLSEVPNSCGLLLSLIQRKTTD